MQVIAYASAVTDSRQMAITRNLLYNVYTSYLRTTQAPIFCFKPKSRLENLFDILY